MYQNKCKHPSYRIEGDFGPADPIWCNVCGYNLILEDFPLSDELIEEWIDWVKSYKIITSEEHNNRGRLLTEKTIKELGPDYELIFRPSKY